MEECWYLARIKRGAGEMVHAQLARLGVKVYSSTPPAVGTHDGEERQPLFADYVLLQVPPDFQEWRAIRYAAGVRQLLRSNENPTPLSDEEVSLRGAPLRTKGQRDFSTPSAGQSKWIP